MSERVPIKWKIRNAYGFLDMLVATLCEHEKHLSDLIDRLEDVTRKASNERKELSTMLEYYEPI